MGGIFKRICDARDRDKGERHGILKLDFRFNYVLFLSGK